MPSVGSTPTTTLPTLATAQQQPQQTSATVKATATATVTLTAPAPAPVAKRRQKLVQKYQQPVPRLPLSLQLQYQHYQPQQMQPLPLPPPQPMVTTTQPAPAGVFSTHNNNVNHSYSNNNDNNNSGSASGGGGSNSNNNNNDMSPISNSNSYSSVDTNQTLLNSIANQRSGGTTQSHSQHRPATSHNRKYSQFMIITPAVSIDRDFEYESHLDFEDFANAAHNNGNLFRLGLRRSDSSSGDDSGNSSDNSFRSNYNPYVHHSRQPLLAKKAHNSSGSHQFYAFSSWRWCTLLCAAMRCFGAGHGNQAPYSSSFVPHHRLRRCSSYNADIAYDYEHFAAPFKARKTRDHMNNITYEL
ncbi:probable serine/threonine-protein kinase dyrk1 [Drosophila hydei]|uniref:Probable serine/threonine-protein kinase dyrk1 n=1 Tax=Drosophila hydei TaxID=7224 RepID=A0A6J1LPB9_DROHY|nr:probable serine/threonine-protein kinase dyrk1 [Drosophila hydei]